MADLWRDFWIRETGTGQQMAQLHDRYMMIMMMMMYSSIEIKLVEFHVSLLQPLLVNTRIYYTRLFNRVSMPHAVGRWRITAEACVRCQARPCCICDGQSSTGTDFYFLKVLLFPLSESFNQVYYRRRVQICVAKRRGYVLRNASLGNFVVVRTCTYTNLDIIAYYTLRLYGIAYCS